MSEMFFFFLYSFCNAPRSFCLFAACADLIDPCEAARCKQKSKKKQAPLKKQTDRCTRTRSPFKLCTWGIVFSRILMDFHLFVQRNGRFGSAVMESFPLLGVRYKPKVFLDPRQRSNMTARISDHITYICLNTVIFMQESGSPGLL